MSTTNIEEIKKQDQKLEMNLDLTCYTSARDKFTSSLIAACVGDEYPA